MNPLIFADVTVFVGSEGEEYKRCRLTMLGTPTNAVLYQWAQDESRWMPIDRLTNAVVTEHIGALTIVGVSDELVQIVGVPANEATVRWEVTERGCKDCG